MRCHIIFFSVNATENRNTENGSIFMNLSYEVIKMTWSNGFN